MKKLKRTLMTGLAVFLLTGCSEDSKQDSFVEQPIPESLSDNSPVVHRAAPKDASVLRARGAIFALTSIDRIYSFSATVKGEAKVSVTIPQQYDIAEVGAPEGGSRMPVPYWGAVNFGEDGKLETTFQGMTALLKIDAATLPEGTTAVVLTTKRDGYLGADELEPGQGEPLSGTFDTELKEGASVAPNRIFRSYDVLRVNLDTYGEDIEQYRYLFIPVIAGSYAKLHVLAITEEIGEGYWEGKVLKTFNANNPFYPNTIVAVEQQSTAIHTPRI